jgi:hypothetical protein
MIFTEEEKKETERILRTILGVKEEPKKPCGRKKGSGKKQRFIYTHQAKIKELRELGHTWETISKFFRIKNRKNITPNTYRREFLKLQEK